MSDIIKTGIYVALSLCAANFIYQSINDRDWDTALERSYFQVIAIACYIYSIH